MTDFKVGNITIRVELDVIDLETIKLKTPVITGNLRDRFNIDIDGNIINDADYADKVEFGTTEKPGAFMVERSLDEIAERLGKRLAEQLNRPGIIRLPDIVIKAGK